jgi:hypothetical protein
MMKIKPEWLTAIFTGIVALTGVCALFYASSQIRQAHEEAQVQHLLTLEKEYRTEPLATYRRVCAQKRLAGEDEPNEEIELLNFFETVALLTNRGYLNDTDVWETFSWDIFSLYADDRENIEQDQKKDANEFLNLALLVSRLEVIEKSRHGADSKPSKDDLNEYWTGESKKMGVDAPLSKHSHTAKIVPK